MPGGDDGLQDAVGGIGVDGRVGEEVKDGEAQDGGEHMPLGGEDMGRVAAAEGDGGPEADGEEAGDHEGAGLAG